MNDQDKTKDQLIQEHVELRQRIAELEAAGSKYWRAEEVLTSLLRHASRGKLGVTRAREILNKAAVEKRQVK